MAEKGASMKSKDIKGGSKVQFMDDVDDHFSKGGGKGGKSKTSTPKYELNPYSDLPKNSQCVTDCEAADILQGIQEQMDCGGPSRCGMSCSALVAKNTGAGCVVGNVETLSFRFHRTSGLGC